MDKSDIPYLSATELSRLIRTKEVSPVEATEAYLDRIDLLDSKLNAFLTICREEALQAARESEQALVHGERKSAMHGIPVAVKDQLYTKGIRTTGGSPIFKDYVPDEDATVIAKLKAAGTILLGKLNMTEFATSTSINHRFTTARNPWDLERYAGSSSSGPGAATAASLCASSLGEDTGGSIRLPAAWCGVVGLKTTWGRVSRYGMMPGIWSLDSVGPMCRTVEDCAMTLQVIAGYDPKDPYTWDVPVPDYQKHLGGDIKGVRVGVVKELLYSDGIEAEVREAVVKATDVLGELAASVEEVSVPLAKHAAAFTGGLKIQPPMTYREFLRHRLQDIGHDNRIGYLAGSILPAQAYYKSLKLSSLLRQQVLETLKKVDVLVSPTVAVVAPKVQPDPHAEIKGAPGSPGDQPAMFGLGSTPGILTHIYSLAGATALSVCCGFTSDNLPIGLQIGGRHFDEGTVLKVAYAYEQNNPWHTRRPPVS